MNNRLIAALLYVAIVVACGAPASAKKSHLVGLDQNIVEIDAYSIHNAGVVMTMMDGKVVYEATAEQTR